MFDDRRDRLDAYLASEGLEAVWFARPPSLAWLTGGDNVVSADADVGVAAAGYDGDGVTVVTSNIERDRLREEELPDDALVEAFAWHDGSLADAVAERTPEPAAADFDVPGLERVDASPLRQPLSDRDARRYRALGEDTAAAVEAAVREADPDDRERDLAAAVSERLTRRGIRTPVLLVGGAERAQAHRHYTTSAARLGEYALVSVGGYRDGLYASVTRAAAFDPPEWFAERTRAAMRVETTALAATRAVGREGGQASEVFSAIQDAYAEAGYEGEWERHHQGGAAGFAGREWKATPTSTEPVELPMGYAYNPTVQGAKSEGTWLVDESDVESLTPPGENWPTETVAAVGYDLELELPAPLGF